MSRPAPKAGRTQLPNPELGEESSAFVVVNGLNLQPISWPCEAPCRFSGRAVMETLQGLPCFEFVYERRGGGQRRAMPQMIPEEYRMALWEYLLNPLHRSSCNAELSFACFSFLRAFPMPGCSHCRSRAEPPVAAP